MSTKPPINNHYIVGNTQYQPWYRRKYPISTFVSSKIPNINLCIVENTQYRPLYRRKCPISTIASSKKSYINHCIVENTHYQPWHRGKYPISTIASSKIPIINHCVVETTYSTGEARYDRRCTFRPTNGASQPTELPTQPLHESHLCCKKKCVSTYIQ